MISSPQQISTSDHIIRRRIADILSAVPDPEVPCVSIVDLGMVVDIIQSDSVWKVMLATTYSGCPAIDVIPGMVRAALADSQMENVQVSIGVSPPWSTDWISENGKQKLLDYGIAPPNGSPALHDEGQPRSCPQCGSTHTLLVSFFGSTACKAAYVCESCKEPFEYFKCF